MKLKKVWMKLIIILLKLKIIKEIKKKIILIALQEIIWEVNIFQKGQIKIIECIVVIL